MKSIYKVTFLCAAVATLAACGPKGADENNTTDAAGSDTSIEAKIGQLATVELTADLSGLSENERKMLPFMFAAADIMDELFWEESVGDKKAFLDTIKDPNIRRYAMINYGPWERLNDDKPFVKGVGKKPEGANFYPKDMTKEDFDKWTSPRKKGLYSMVRRDDGGFLQTIPYHEYFGDKIDRAAALIDSAAKYADDKGLKNYLTLRAKALRTDEYQASDMAWLDMKNNNIDFVIGPIESYEDKMFGYRAAHEAYILIKDKKWSDKLAKYAAMLPELQAGLPVDGKYKAEKAGSDSDLGAYDVVYYAGDCNAGSKTIAVNLPNDEEVQLKKGTRRLQLKNAMRAKFDKIMIPISDELIDPSQRANITFDAFFSTIMFHEVAHGLGIKNTINGKGTVREALKDEGSALEEGKADILGLYMITKLHEKGEFSKKSLTIAT
ncbi:MAG: Zn-dependent hydrolase [Sphingobacteriales bacterium JAD_PAG50586_3]|nr:MAG: Zn-dependent hydrolase [Sphingobacteriales bacterium JAD_PAG50586_3]